MTGLGGFGGEFSEEPAWGCESATLEPMGESTRVVCAGPDTGRARLHRTAQPYDVTHSGPG